MVGKRAGLIGSAVLAAGLMQGGCGESIIPPRQTDAAVESGAKKDSPESCRRSLVDDKAFSLGETVYHPNIENLFQSPPAPDKCCPMVLTETGKDGRGAYVIITEKLLGNPPQYVDNPDKIYEGDRSRYGFYAGGADVRLVVKVESVDVAGKKANFSVYIEGNAMCGER